MRPLLGVHIVVTLLYFNLSYLKAEEYLILDPQEFNIWNPNELDTVNSIEKEILRLCEYYHLTLNGEKINCYNLKISSKQFDDDLNHKISKREASETELEGSGTGDDDESDKPEVSIALYNKTALNDGDKKLLTNETSEDQLLLKANTIEEMPVAENVNEEETKPLEEEPRDNDENLEKQENTLEESKIHDKELDNIPKTNGTDSLPEESPEKEQSSSQLVSEGNVTKQEKEEELLPPTRLSVQQTQPPLVHFSPTEEIIKNNTKKNIQTSSSSTEKLITTARPSETNRTEPNKEGKEAEVVDTQQSGNAVLLKEPQIAAPVHVEGSEGDKALKKLAPNAKISKESSEQATEGPNAGESAKDVKTASKDTTILIVLFVVVIAIGVAAFAHNYIKKRKQRRSNNNVNGIKRSLQNLASPNGKNNADVEQGTEMKPLIKEKDENSQVSTTAKDYSDSQKDMTA